MKASDYYYHEQFMESFSSASYSKWDDDPAWSSQEWKTDTEMYERSGRPDETSWKSDTRNSTWFSHEENLHDGTAQSVVNEVMPRDRPGRPDVDPQREARPQNFIIGNDEAELELSVESRSFVNRVNDQVRKRQKRIFKCYRRWREIFYDMRGKNYKQSSIHRKYNRSHTQTSVRHINKIGVLNKMRSQD